MKITVPYLPGSSLKQTLITLKGIRSMYPFTSWSWILLGFYFTLSSYISFQFVSIIYFVIDNYTLYNININNNIDIENMLNTKITITISPYILRSCILFWETSGPFALLVASIIKYVIWPRTLQETGDTTQLRSFTTLCMHNVNVLFVVIEVCYMSNISILLLHISFAPMIGCMYVLFSWYVCMSWTTNVKQYGPQFIYFFLDTTVPGYTPTIAILGLLFVLILSYIIFVLLSYILSFMEGNNNILLLLYHTIFAIGICRLVMRFRD